MMAKPAQFQVNDVVDTVQTLLQKTIADLKSSVSTATPSGQRLFFPNGIELIKVVVRVGPADVEVTIAGDKGVQPTVRMLEDPHMNVGWPENKDPIFRGNLLIWDNDEDKPVTIEFDTPIPLDPPKFTVPGKGGEALTHVRNTIDAGEYTFKRTPSLPMKGNPKIIIQ